MSFSQFVDNWPTSRKEQFSYDALRAIFDYLEEYEESTGEKVEFDPIAICCEWSEAESAIEAAQQYEWNPEADITDKDDNLRDPDEVRDENNAAALKWLQESTTVLELDGGGVVYIQF